MSVYAVIHTGGKQYRVNPGDVIRVEKLDAQSNDRVELGQVYLLAVDGQVTAGKPVVQGARVMAQVVDQDRAGKIIVFKKKRRKGYQKTIGHRQCFTSLRITEIIHNGAVYKEQEKKPDSRAVAPAVTKPAKARKADKKKTEPPKPVVPPALPKKKEAPAPEASPQAHPQSGALTKASPDPGQVGMPEKKEQPKTEISTPLPKTADPVAPAAKPEAAAPPPLVEPSEELSPEARKRRWLYGAVAGALALLLLILLLLLGGPGPEPQAGKPSGDAPAEKKVETAPKAKKPPVRDSRIKETAPVDKPSAPAQPPD